MKIYRQTIGCKERVLLYANATITDWNNLRSRANKKAARESYGFCLPKIYPQSTSAFSVELCSGKTFMFQKVG
jgi:hypothetical protein